MTNIEHVLSKTKDVVKAWSANPLLMDTENSLIMLKKDGVCELYIWTADDREMHQYYPTLADCLDAILDIEL